MRILVSVIDNSKFLERLMGVFFLVGMLRTEVSGGWVIGV